MTRNYTHTYNRFLKYCIPKSSKVIRKFKKEKVED